MIINEERFKNKPFRITYNIAFDFFRCFVALVLTRITVGHAPGKYLLWMIVLVVSMLAVTYLLSRLGLVPPAKYRRWS